MYFITKAIPKIIYWQIILANIGTSYFTIGYFYVIETNL